MPTSRSGKSAAEARGDERAPVAALRGEAVVAEHVGHQLREAFGDLRPAEARLPRRERQRVAGQRRRDDGEGVAGSPPKRAGSVSTGSARGTRTPSPASRARAAAASARGPLPGSWMKCRSMPASGTVNCGKAFSFASCAPVEAARASSRRARAGRRRWCRDARARAAARRASACARGARAGRRQRRRELAAKRASGLVCSSWRSCLETCYPQRGPC